MSQPGDVTRLLQALSHGDPDAFQRLVPLIYAELRALAARALRRERHDHTLATTGLVHEAYLRLVDQRRVEWKDRSHFLAIAAQSMRRILVDHARRRGTKKRGAQRARIALEDAFPAGDDPAMTLTDIDDALRSLAELDAQQAQVVELRFFGGLTIEQTAEVLNVSPATVKRDWTVAKAWLRRKLSDADRVNPSFP